MLLVPDLIFLVLLTSNQELMGEHVSPWWMQIGGWGIVMLYVAMSAVTIYVSLAAL